VTLTIRDIDIITNPFILLKTRIIMSAALKRKENRSIISHSLHVRQDNISIIQH